MTRALRAAFHQALLLLAAAAALCAGMTGAASSAFTRVGIRAGLQVGSSVEEGAPSKLTFSGAEWEVPVGVKGRWTGRDVGT